MLFFIIIIVVLLALLLASMTGFIAWRATITQTTMTPATGEATRARLPAVLSEPSSREIQRLQSEINELRQVGYSVKHQKLTGRDNANEDCLTISRTVAHHSYSNLQIHLVCKTTFPTTAPTALVELELRTGQTEEVQPKSTRLQSWQESYRLVNIVEDIIKQLEAEKGIFVGPGQVTIPSRAPVVASQSPAAVAAGPNWPIVLGSAVVVFLIVLGAGLGFVFFMQLQSQTPGEGEAAIKQNDQPNNTNGNTKSLPLDNPTATFTPTLAPTVTPTSIPTPSPTVTPMPTPTPGFQFALESMAASEWQTISESLEIPETAPNGQATNLIIIAGLDAQISVINEADQKETVLLTGDNGIAFANLSIGTYSIIAYDTAKLVLAHGEGDYHSLQIIPTE